MQAAIASATAENHRPTLFTIGYQHHSLGSLIRSLIDNGIEILLDVRQNPYSRKPGFSKVPLGDALTGAAITYLHCPDLGTPPQIRTTYKQSGSISEALAEYDRYISVNLGAITALAKVAKGKRVCLLCLENDHNMCHRGIIARRLCEITK